jgi:hypothetical protein
MDAQRFEEPVRLLDAGRRRRRAALRLLAGGSLGAALARLGLGEAAAGCKKVGARCERGDRCCVGRCKDGRCRCRPNQERCGRECCTADQVCRDDPFTGVKTCEACRTGTVPCGGDCCGPEQCVGGRCQMA